MNRRELFTKVVALMTAIGVLGTPRVSAVECDANPALFVVEVADLLNAEQIERVTTELKAIVRGTPFASARCVVLNGGARLSVYDASGMLLNIQMADA